MEIRPLKTIVYTDSTGKQPFAEWQKSLSKEPKTVVLTRLARVRAGNLGDYKPIKNGEGIYKLRIDFGPGYRIYFGKQGTTIVVLLAGGDKGTQSRDIAKAKKYWLDFKEQHNG